jgi:hypothetical protein
MNQPNLTPAVRQNTPKLLRRTPHTLRIARRKLQPGQAGTRKLLAEYDEKLVCVRYRYDAENQHQIKTVELVVEEKPWQPRPAKIPLNQTTELRIEYGEIGLRNLVKAAGGKWNREKQVWELPYREVLRLGLIDRIVDGQQKPQDAKSDISRITRGYDETA